MSIDTQTTMTRSPLENPRNAGATQTLAVVLNTNQAMSSAIIHRLEALFPGTTLHLFDSLNAALAKTKNDPVLLPLRQPLAAVALRLAEGTTPEAALEAWKDETTALLDTARKVRRRTVLIDVETLATEHLETMTWLSRRFGLSGDRGPEKKLAPLPAPAEPEALLLAAAAFWADESASELADTVESMMHGPVHRPDLPKADLLTALARIQHLAGENVHNEREALAERLKTVEEEREALLAQQETLIFQENEEIRFLRDQLNAYLRDFSILETNQATMAERIESHEAERADRLRRERILDSAILRERSTRAGMQAELAETRRRADILATVVLRDRILGERSVAPSALDELQSELDRVYGSKSWKVTAPLRAVRRALSKDH